MDWNHVRVEKLAELHVHSHQHTIIHGGKIFVKFRSKETNRKDTIFSNSGPLTDMKLIPDSLAMAFAKSVLP